jgi:hypothetical protein
VRDSLEELAAAAGVELSSAPERAREAVSR